jgi:hypothetical protein
MPSVFSKLPVMISDEDIIDPRYQNCIIYKLVHKDDEDAYEKYVGHTITSLKERMWMHRNSCNNNKNKCYNYKVYQYIRENGGFEMWEMIKIIDYPCKNDIEAGKKEGEYIRGLNCSLNTKIAGRSFKEYYETNREYFREKQREHYHNNIEKMRKRDRDRYESRKEHRSKYNKEKYKQNKDIIIKCDNCGCDSRKSDIARHKKTLKCINHINTP